HGRLLGIGGPFLRETCGVVVDLMGDVYTHLRSGREAILDAVEAEEARFAHTLESGSARLDDLLASGGEISGADAFRLHDTFGFPIDLTVEMAAERGVTVDRAGFDAAMAEQRDRSRGEKRAGLEIGDDLAGLASEFIGYPNVTDAESVGVIGVERLSDGRWAVVLDRTPFYAEGGGQVGDRGSLAGPSGRLEVEDTQRVGEATVHVGGLSGELAVGDMVTASVDRVRRWAAARNHTGTHLLHRALRDVLGEAAKQAGSWVGPDGLRFDFPATSATPREALREVERIVNAQVRRDAPIVIEHMPIERAQALGADMFFGEKYLPASVRVVQVDGYSKELCGGTHCASTGQIGSFVITGESSVGAGLRRIEAVTGEAATEFIAARLEALHETATLLGEREEHVPQRVEALLGRLREAEKAAKAPRSSAARLDAAAALRDATDAGKAKVVITSYADADAAALRTLADDLRSRAGRFVAVVGGISEAKPSLLVAASRDLAAEGFDSGAIVRAAAPIIGGGGGGRPDLAQAGGRDPDLLDAALQEAGRLALESLARIESA
ncbi:MAG: alanine--tRNA ligase, partial [Chloroflexi bacterium]|nr:alanine--tRNA ligase [Chloroflexota bacterium]